MLFFTFFNCIFSIAGNRAAGTVHYFFKECSVFMLNYVISPGVEHFSGKFPISDFFNIIVKMVYYAS